MIKKIFGGFFALLLMQLLVACGSGDDCEFTGGCGGAGTGDGAGGSPISLKLVSKTTGLETTTITPAEPVRLVATVVGLPEPLLVNFATTKGTLSDSGTALTDSSQASVDFTVGNATGAGEATATVIHNDETYVATVLYQISSVASGITLELQSASTGLETQSISAADPGRLVARVAGITEPVIVNFSSTLGTISNSGAVLSDVTGMATVDLMPGDSVGAGTVTASVTIGTSATITAQVLFQINASDGAAGSTIQFVSATPETITLKGAGGNGNSETSIVVFKVLDSNGNPVSGQSVDFALNTTSGGIALDPATASSDASGLVRTVVSSGTISTSVRVTASMSDAGVLVSQVQSSRLVISTGIPDQDSISLSVEIYNPEAGDFDGVEDKLYVRLADGFNNPVADGTVVSFSTEGASITPFCTTVGGGCDVTWVSQEPRPVDGRVTVTATAIGEESFPDLNGNGRFDASEMTKFLDVGINGLKYDLPEAFADFNEDGILNGLDELIDFNANGLWDDRDDLYNGSLCSVPAHAGCSTSKTLNVRSSVVIVMSGSEVFGEWIDLGGGEAMLCLYDRNFNQLPYDTAVTIKYTGIFAANPQDTINWTNSADIPGCIKKSYVGPGSGAAEVKATTATSQSVTQKSFGLTVP